MNDTTTIELASIEVVEEMQARAECSNETINEYAQCLDKLPPLTLVKDDDVLYLVDGFHRYFALKAGAMQEAVCQVFEMPFAEGQWWAASMNQVHGLRRTNADKRHAVKLALQSGVGAGLSDRAIGEHVGVDHKTVASVRNELIQREKARTTQIDADKNGTPQREGADAVGDIQASAKIVDKLGVEVLQPAARAAFVSAQAMRERCSVLRKVKKYLQEIGEWNHDLAGVAGADVGAEMNRLINRISSAIPYATCPYCDKPDDRCDVCGGQCWVTKQQYQAAPEELRGPLA